MTPCLTLPPGAHPLMDAAVASPVPPVGIPTAGGTPTAVAHPAMASGGVAALPPPRGSAANLGADAPAGGLSAPPINAVEAAPGPVTGSSAATVPGPSVKHRGDGPLSSVNSLVNDFGSFSMEGAVAPGQPRLSPPQPAAASLPPVSTGALAAASGGEPAEVGMTAPCPAGGAVAPLAAAAGTTAAAGTAAPEAAVVTGTAATAGTAGAPTSAAWAGSAASPAVGNTHPVGATDRAKLGGLGPSHVGVPNGVVEAPNRSAGLPNGVGAASHGRVAGGPASAADAHAYGESTQPRETVMEMWVPLAAVGSVIGSHGTVIKSLQLKSGAIIVVHNDVLDATASSKMITINGPPEAVTMAKTLVNEVVARPRGGGGGGGGGGYGGGGRGGSFSQSLSAPAGALTAPDRLRQIASQTGAKLVVTGPAAGSSVGSSTGGAVAAAAGAPTGTSAAADARGTSAARGPDRPPAPALVHVQITGRQHAVRNAASMLTEGHGRHSGGRPGACVVSAGGVSPPRGGGSGGSEGVTDRSPSGPPRRASNAAADGATASGGGGLSAGSGSGSPVRETIGVRNDKVGLLIGRGGVHVQTIQDRSGASVQVHKDTNAPMNSGGNGAGLAGASGIPAIAAGGRAVTPAVVAVATEGGAPTAASNAAAAAAGGVPQVVTTGGASNPALPSRAAPPMLRAVTITGTRGAVDLAKKLISDRVGGIHPAPPGTAMPASHPHHYHGPHHHGHHGQYHPHGGYHGVLPPLAAAPPHLGPLAYQHHVAMAAAASASAGGGTSPPRGMPPGVGPGAHGATGVGSPPPALPGPGPGGALGPAVGRMAVSPMLVAQQPFSYYPQLMYRGPPQGHVQPPAVMGSPPYDGMMYAGPPGGAGAPPAPAVPANVMDVRAYYAAAAAAAQQFYAHQQHQAAAAAAATPRQGGLPVAGVPPTAMYGYGMLPTAPPAAAGGMPQPVPDGGRRAVDDSPVA